MPLKQTANNRCFLTDIVEDHWLTLLNRITVARSMLTKINRKMKSWTPCKIFTREGFNVKLGTRDYVADVTQHATLESNRPSGGFYPNRGNVTHLWLFCYTVFFLGHAPRSNRRTDAYAEWLKWRVSAQACSFWGSGRWVTSYKEILPEHSPKRGANKQFQAETPKSLHHNISGSINPTK